MFGLIVILFMTLSGHPWIINKMSDVYEEFTDSLVYHYLIENENLKLPNCPTQPGCY